MQDKNNTQINDGVVNPDNQWIKDIVIEKYKYYGFEEHIGLNYDFPFMEETKGDIDFNNKKWACVNWYIGNLNTVHRDLLIKLEMFSKEQVKEQIMIAYNIQVQEFQDWEFRKGVYVEYYNTMESISKSLGSYTPNGYYDIYRLKWLFISACFSKFYKVTLDRYFPEQLEQTIQPPQRKNKAVTGFDLGFNDDTKLETLYHVLIAEQFLHHSTKVEHFINAFNGKELIDFKPLKWNEPTKGAIVFFFFSKQKKTPWESNKHLFEPANYKQLLSQSRGNGTFETLKKELEKIIL